MSGPAQERPDLAALSAWAPELAKTFVSLASDIALVIDADGVIRNVAQTGADPMAPSAEEWVGRAWIDTVSGETRPKIANLLKEVAATGIARSREVNHPLGSDINIPVAYTAIRLGANGPVLAVGRDLRAIAAIQQRYVESQQDLERGYWQARQAEARYQLLFQVATDAVMVVDGETLQVIEANEAAARLHGTTAEQLRGQHASAGFEHHARSAVNELLANARASGRSGEIRARLQGTYAGTSVVATPFRADDAMRLLMRMRTAETTGTSAGLNQTISRLVDPASDAVVVTDSSGRVLIANPAFLSLAQIASEAQLKGQPLMGWLRLGDQPLAALVAQVRRDGIARRIDACVKRAAASVVQVEVSAALLTEGDQECIGFTLHPTLPAAERPAAGTAASAAVSTAVGAAMSDALTSVLRAGIEALGPALPAHTLAAIVAEAAASLGLSAEALSARLWPGAGTPGATLPQ
jgi:transcriptional regulator PpsR